MNLNGLFSVILFFIDGVGIGERNADNPLSQIDQIKKMGNVKDLVGMIPGMGKALKDTEIDNDAFKSIEAIIHSMTPKERENPNLLNTSRRRRIAAGSGNSIQEVNKLIKQFEDTRKMMKMMSNKKNMMGLMKNMSKMGGGIPKM